MYKNKLISCYANVSGLIDAITELLAASQSFMRTKQVFGNFISMLIVAMHFMYIIMYKYIYTG